MCRFIHLTLVESDREQRQGKARLLSSKGIFAAKVTSVLRVDQRLVGIQLPGRARTTMTPDMRRLTTLMDADRPDRVVPSCSCDAEARLQAWAPRVDASPETRA